MSFVPKISVRPRATDRIKKFILQSGGDQTTLIRLTVTEHDEESFAYTMRLESNTRESDVLFSAAGLQFCADQHSAPFFDGVAILYFDGATRIQRGDNPREPVFDRSLGVLATLTVHTLSTEQRWAPNAQPPVADVSSSAGTDSPLAGTDDLPQRAIPDVPAAPALSPTAVRVQELLDTDTGLKCLPNFFKRQLWRVIRREPDALIDRYTAQHLSFLSSFVEPLAEESDENGYREFTTLCSEMSTAPNLAYVGLRFGFSESENEDVTQWLRWAAALESEPVKCLYCVACFVAVPPVAGEEPAIYTATTRGLAASSLCKLGSSKLGCQAMESLLGLTPRHYKSWQALVVALQASLLAQLGPAEHAGLLDILDFALRSDQRADDAQLLGKARQHLSG